MTNTAKGRAYFRRNYQGRPRGLDTYVTAEWESSPVPFTTDYREAAQLTQAEYEKVKGQFAQHDWTWAWTGQEAWDDKKKLAVYAAVAGPAEQLEWSGTRQGQGYGPMGSGPGGAEYAACPVCGGLKEPNGEFRAEAVGHQPGCVLADLLGAKTRPLARGEQAEIAL